MRRERYNLHGTGYQEHEVYHVPPSPDGDMWAAVTNIPCPVPGCGQTVVWYEAGYVPGYRVCMAPVDDAGSYDMDTIRHRFQAQPDEVAPFLIRDDDGPPVSDGAA